MLLSFGFGDFIFARVETRETGNAVSARQGPAGLDRGQDMDTLARRVPASLSAKSHARTFIAAEHPSQLGCG
jgi:hypothetical protein